MKISKIAGFGSFGHYVDDVDFDHITAEEWLEIGKLNLEGLVTVLRNIKISKDQYYKAIKAFGTMESSWRVNMIKKYGHDYDALDEDSYKEFDDFEKAFLRNKKYYYEVTEEGHTLTRITGKVDENGNALGVFNSGDLGWHSNEGSLIAFAPVVALLGNEGMVGSSTGFMQTVDYYESLTESFRSELDEMVMVHKYVPGNINTQEVSDPQTAIQIRMSQCPIDGAETPLVVRAPNGRKGLRYTVHTRSSIKGMTAEQSSQVFAEIDKHLFSDKYVFDHWYQQDNDMLLFDNSVTQHRRIGGEPNRLAYRYHYYPKNLLTNPWIPYDLPHYAEEYRLVKSEIDRLNTM
jgi:alpha-ketoglutarate-dependent taurine dioxygenase